MTLHDIMLEVNNFFEYQKEYNSYEITTNSIKFTEDFENDYVVGQYIRIYNSILNDGVYKITNVASDELTLDATLQAENSGRNIVLYGLKPPADFITLSNTIISNGKEEDVSSETVSRYSVSYGNGGHWTKTYKKALDKYRKMGWPQC